MLRVTLSTVRSKVVRPLRSSGGAAPRRPAVRAARAEGQPGRVGGAPGEAPAVGLGGRLGVVVDRLGGTDELHPVLGERDEDLTEPLGPFSQPANTICSRPGDLA